MIVVLIIGILLAIAVPNFITARTTSRLQSCVADLKEIDTAKEQFAMENGLISGGAVNDAADLCPVYLKEWPTGPVTGVYNANAVGVDPTFNGNNATWLTTNCSGTTANASCPF